MIFSPEIAKIENCPPEADNAFGRYFLSRTRIKKSTTLRDINLDLTSHFERGMRLENIEDECLHHGISLTDSEDEARQIIAQVPTIINMAVIELDESAGIVQHTPRGWIKNHHTWWSYEGTSRAKVVVADEVII